MNKVIFGLITLLVSTITLAKPVLICNTTNAGGALIKQIIIEQRDKGLSVKAESYSGGGLVEIKILKSISTPVSTKHVLDSNTGAKTSLVIYKKQAVMLYEAASADDFTDNGANVEFLSCK